MKYFTCLTCPPHSTLDHDLRGTGPCLFPDCTCQKFGKGAVFVKAGYVPMSKGEATQAASERGEKKST